MELLLAIAGVGIGLTLWVLGVYLKTAYTLRKFPGPLALPLIGNLYDLRAIHVMKYISANVREYGKMFTFWPGNKAMLVVAETTAVRQILTDTRTFIKGADYSEKFAVVFGEGLVTSNGERHKHDRSCLGKYFIRSNVGKHLSMICEQTRKGMDEILDEHAGPGKAGVDMQEYFHLITLRVFGKFAMSFDYTAPENRETAKWLNWAVSWGSHVIGEHIVLNLPMWDIIPRVRKLKNVVMGGINKHLSAMLDARIEMRKRGEETPDDTLTAMLDDQQERSHILAQLCTLMSAGHDTTAFFGCYMAHLLAQNPEVQDKCKAEVREILGERTELTMEDVENLKYCNMVMKEVLRLYTVIPFVNRTATKDVQLKDSKTVIPAGTVCLVPLYYMNRDPSLWDEPNEFRPERFAEISGHSSAKNGYLPFGYGSRTCIGNTLALIEGTVMISLLMQRYRFKPEPSFRPALMGGISLVSKNGIKVRLEHDPVVV